MDKDPFNINIDTIEPGEPLPIRALYLWEGRAMYIGEIVDNTPHSHHALQLLLSFGEPFRLHTGGTWHAGRCALIAPDHVHQLEGKELHQILLLIDHEAVAAQDLVSRYLSNKSVMIMDGLSGKTDLQKLKGVFSSCTRAYSCVHASYLAEKVISVLSGGAKQNSRPMNERVQRALDVIREIDADKVSVGEIAGMVHLSESRLIHLFTREVGIPIRRYLLWRRMVQGIQLVLSGRSLTEAAHNAGFADSAHLSRTFRDMFGFTPSEILKNSRFIQVFSCIA
jgi:AraC-like DNA-binding protein